MSSHLLSAGPRKNQTLSPFNESSPKFYHFPRTITINKWAANVQWRGKKSRQRNTKLMLNLHIQNKRNGPKWHYKLNSMLHIFTTTRTSCAIKIQIKRKPYKLKSLGSWSGANWKGARTCIKWNGMIYACDWFTHMIFVLFSIHQFAHKLDSSTAFGEYLPSI